MKTKLYDKSGKAGKEIELPKNFSIKVREDILSKAFEAEKEKQPTGAFKLAGMQYAASGKLKHGRRMWKTTYGKGISRVPRKILSRHGSSFNWVGATVASTRGGRRAHPPKAEENQYKKINKKELLIAYNSGFTGTFNKAWFEKKYNSPVSSYSAVFSSDILPTKTKDFLLTLKQIFGDYYEKLLKQRSIRAGKGKSRGRKYKKTVGLLFVVGSDEEMKRKGIDVVKVKELKLKHLAPNGVPGRFSCYTEKAIKEIGEEFK